MECRWQVEIDPFCRKVLAKHWPDVKRYEDVRDVGAHNLEPVDLICGGFPCQDISNAGKRAGIEGERSGLWDEYARIVRELRPRHVLVENVAALLGRGLGRVLGDLAEIGYDAEWDCIPAAAVGAPHVRDRLFVVAHDPEHGRGPGWARRPATSRKGQSEQPLSLSHSEGYGRPVRRVGAHADDDGPRGRWCDFGSRAPSDDRWEWWGTEPDVGRVADGVPARVDRLRGLGNAVVPQVAEWIGRRIMSADATQGAPQ